MKILKKYIKNNILKTFFKINLSWFEKTIAEENLNDKYVYCIKNAVFRGILILPAILFLEMQYIISILIPITLVAWTAWFAITLSNIKKKFEDFWMELTIDIFDSFVTSLFILFLIASISLLSPFLNWLNIIWIQYPLIQLISAILWIYVIFINIFKVFLGSLKYDMNDSMLSWQNEVAEKYFKKSISFLNITAKNLREWKWLQVANYYIWTSLNEIFLYIKLLGNWKYKNIDIFLEQSQKLMNNPSMKQKKADYLSIELINNFLSFIDNSNFEMKKSIYRIKNELKSISNSEKNNEMQEMVDIRLSMIFEEIWKLIDNYWETLFLKK